MRDLIEIIFRCALQKTLVIQSFFKSLYNLIHTYQNETSPLAIHPLPSTYQNISFFCFHS